MKDVNFIRKLSEEFFKKSIAAADRGICVFPSHHSKVTDKNDHFPINNERQARNALSRVNQFSSAPKWYSGSLESLVNSVVQAVSAKYENIEISDKSKNPGKG